MFANGLAMCSALKKYTNIQIKNKMSKEAENTELSDNKALHIDSVSKRYQVTDIQLADWESVAIGDTKTNKVVCHFITENGYDEAVKLANKINDFLNVC